LSVIVAVRFADLTGWILHDTAERRAPKAGRIPFADMTGLSKKTAVANVGASATRFGRGLPCVYTERLTGAPSRFLLLLECVAQLENSVDFQ
jgi:hypothetical protein